MSERQVIYSFLNDGETMITDPNGAVAVSLGIIGIPYDYKGMPIISVDRDPLDGRTEFSSEDEIVPLVSNDDIDEKIAEFLAVERIKGIKPFLRSDDSVIWLQKKFLHLFTGNLRFFQDDDKESPVIVTTTHGSVIGAIMPFLN